MLAREPQRFRIVVPAGRYEQGYTLDFRTDRAECGSVAVVVGDGETVLEAGATYAVEASLETFRYSMPDAAFRNWLVELGYVTVTDDRAGTVEVTEAGRAVRALDCRSRKFTSLDGIECFAALEELDCSYNRLVRLDAGRNRALATLRCRANGLVRLDVAGCAELETLDCNGNALESLDVTGNARLATLYCNGNRLTELDVVRNDALETFYCYANRLVSLDASHMASPGATCSTAASSRRAAPWSSCCAATSAHAGRRRCPARRPTRGSRCLSRTGPSASRPDGLGAARGACGTARMKYTQLLPNEIMLLKANCKINIGLDVLRRRTDGYHDLDTVMVPVADLYDEVEVVRAPEDRFRALGLRIDCADGDNLCMKAVRLMRERYAAGPVAVTLRKRVPFGAGLGGGSSDATAVVLAMNELFGLGLPSRNWWRAPPRWEAIRRFSCAIARSDARAAANGWSLSPSTWRVARSCWRNPPRASPRARPMPGCALRCPPCRSAIGCCVRSTRGRRR